MTLLEQREKELADQRQVNWDVFVASLRDWAAHESWLWLLDAVARVYGGFGFDGGDWPDHELEQFADLYGWPDTLRALAQAMQTDEQFKAEAEARR